MCVVRMRGRSKGNDQTRTENLLNFLERSCLFLGDWWLIALQSSANENLDISQLGEVEVTLWIKSQFFSRLWLTQRTT